MPCRPQDLRILIALVGLAHVAERGLRRVDRPDVRDQRLEVDLAPVAVPRAPARGLTSPERGLDTADSAPYRWERSQRGAGMRATRSDGTGLGGPSPGSGRPFSVAPCWERSQQKGPGIVRDTVPVLSGGGLLSRQLRIGIVGCGNVGAGLHLLAWQAHPELARVVGLFPPLVDALGGDGDVRELRPDQRRVDPLRGQVRAGDPRPHAGGARGRLPRAHPHPLRSRRSGGRARLVTEPARTMPRSRRLRDRGVQAPGERARPAPAHVTGRSRLLTPTAGSDS